MKYDPFGLGNYVDIQPNQNQAAQPKKKTKNFWQDQISTGGSLAGALAGGAAGTALLPGVGTVIGALLGGAAGGAGGQVAENAITGDNLGNDVASEALWGGATALPFGAVGKLGKAGFTVAKGLGSDAARTAAKDLVYEAGVKTMSPKAVQNLSLSDALKNAPAQAAAERLASQPTLASKIGDRLGGAANDLAIKQFRLTPSQLANFKTKFGEDAGQTIRKYGFTSAEDIAAKGINPLQEQFGTLVKNAGDISKETLQKNFSDTIAKLKGANSSTNRAIGSQLEGEVSSLLSKYGDTIPASKLNDIRREFDSLVNYTNKAADPNKYGVNKRVADVLRKTLQGADSTGKLKDVGNEISKLRQLSDNVAKQGELGRGSLPLNIPSLLGGAAGSGLGGIPGMAAGLVATNAVNSPMGRKAAMGLIEGAASKVGQIGAGKVGQSIPQAVGRIGTVGAVKSSVNDQSLSDLNNMADNAPMSSATTMPTNVQNMDSSYPQTQQPSNPFGYSSAQIGQALMAAYADGNTKAAQQLESMYSLVSDYEKSQAKTSSLNSTAATQVASNANATNTLDQLEGLFGSAGGGSGKVGGALANALAGAGLNGDVQTYNDLAASSVSQLARALNGGGQVSDADAAVVIQALPRVTDSKEVAQRKFAALRGRLQAAMQNTLQYSGGQSSASDLASALQNQ